MNRKLAWLSGYAIAMAALEAIVVVYLRTLYYPEDVRLIFPLKFMAELDFVLELGREAAAVAMILAVAALSEWERRGRVFAAFVYVFGVWDVFYYVWLKVMIGWPMSWLEWDVLFLDAMDLARALDLPGDDRASLHRLGLADAQVQRLRQLLEDSVGPLRRRLDPVHRHFFAARDSDTGDGGCGGHTRLCADNLLVVALPSWLRAHDGGNGASSMNGDRFSLLRCRRAARVDP